MGMQPIIRGVQNVGNVDIRYLYLSPDHKLTLPSGIVSFKNGTKEIKEIATATSDTTTTGIYVAGFRLDSEFIRANPQIASSVVIPLLGGGGIALTNNNRTGTLVVRCTKVGVPGGDAWNLKSSDASEAGVRGTTTAYYDLVTLAQVQQSQAGGDSYGANITIDFVFSGVTTSLTFEMCTVQSVDPLGLSGNDAVDYNVAFNYLNWSLAQTIPDTTPEAGS